MIPWFVLIGAGVLALVIVVAYERRHAPPRFDPQGRERVGLR